MASNFRHLLSCGTIATTSSGLDLLSCCLETVISGYARRSIIYLQFELLICHCLFVVVARITPTRLPTLYSYTPKFLLELYSLSPGFWQSFISIEVCRDCIPALASSCKKQLMGFFVCLLFFLKVKRIS